MTPAEIVRLKTSDKPVFVREDDFQADDTQTYFKLVHQDILATPPPVVTVDGTAATPVTDYNVDYNNGSITFTTAPTAGELIVIEYYTVVFTDTEVTQFLSEAGNDTNYAASLLLFAWAANAAKLAKKQTLAGGGGSGTDVEDTSVTAEQLRKSAQGYLDLYIKVAGDPFSTAAEADGLTEIAWTEHSAQELFVQENFIRNR